MPERFGNDTGHNSYIDPDHSLGQILLLCVFNANRQIRDEAFDVLYSVNKFFVHPRSARFFLASIGSHGRAQLKRVRLDLRVGTLSQPAWTLLAECTSLELLEINLNNTEAVAGMNRQTLREATCGASKEKRKSAKAAVLTAQDLWARHQIQSLAPISCFKKLPHVILRWYGSTSPWTRVGQIHYPGPEIQRIDTWVTDALLQKGTYIQTTEEDISSVSSISDSEGWPSLDEDSDAY